MKKTILITTVVTCFLLFVFVACSDKDDGNNTNLLPLCEQQLENPVQCKHQLPDCDGEKLTKSVRCLGINANGKDRCNNNTTNPCEFCHTHISQYNGRCTQSTHNGCGYCEQHKQHYTAAE